MKKSFTTLQAIQSLIENGYGQTFSNADSRKEILSLTFGGSITHFISGSLEEIPININAIWIKESD